MTEPKRNEIVSRWRAGSSIRKIARELGLARNTVSRVLAQIEARRTGHEGSPIRRRPSRLDPYLPVIQELLGRYPDLTAVRLLEELRERGFTGGYTVVRQQLGVLRPRSAPLPVVRFETAPGAQAQMDYAVYDLDFTSEGRRRFRDGQAWFAQHGGKGIPMEDVPANCGLNPEGVSEDRSKRVSD